MKRIKDVIKRNEWIQCKTRFEAEEYCKIAHNQGLTWCTGSCYTDNKWDIYKENTIYSHRKGVLGSAQHPNNYISIISFQEFKKRLTEQTI